MLTTYSNITNLRDLESKAMKTKDTNLLKNISIYKVRASEVNDISLLLDLKCGSINKNNIPAELKPSIDISIISLTNKNQFLNPKTGVMEWRSKTPEYIKNIRLILG
jgi:hypothetical protein